MSRGSLAAALAIALTACGGGAELSASTSLPPASTQSTTPTTIPTTTTSSSTTLAPTTTVATTTLPTTTTTLPITTTTAPGLSREALDYFAEVALGAEFGDSTQAIVKWNRDVRIAVHGSPTAEDLAALDAVIADLNRLIDTIEVAVVGTGQNVDLHFAPADEFASIEPNYVRGNMGFAWVSWDGARNITGARLLISTTGINQMARNHLIREELTQSMGLLNDSRSYPDSIFQSSWTLVQEYTRLDEQVIELLYLPEVRAGMTGAEVEAAIAGLVG